MAKTRINYDRTTVTQTVKYPRTIGPFTFRSDGRFTPTEKWLTDKSKEA